MTTEVIEQINEEAEKLTMYDDFKIAIYGIEAQDKLSELSKTVISSMFDIHVENSSKLISEIVEKIEDTNNKSHKVSFPFQNKDEVRGNYRNLIYYLNHVSIKLRMQQSSLLHDLSVLKRMQKILTECHVELDEYIKAGQKKMIEFEEDDSLATDRFENKKRFENRLRSLEISRAIALQGMAQAKLMINNDNMLIEKIESSLTETIPLWRNQISALIGIENMKDAMIEQRNLSKKLQRSITESERVLKKGKKNYKQAEHYNIELERTMNEMAQLVNHMKECQGTFSNILQGQN